MRASFPIGKIVTIKLNAKRKVLFERILQDFMFQLSQKEASELSRSQFVTLKRGQNIKYFPYAFTENGVAMLSSVLNSERAIQVNIQIMRTFTKIWEILATHGELRQKIEEMEKKYDYQFKVVFDTIKKLLEPSEKPMKNLAASCEVSSVSDRNILLFIFVPRIPCSKLQGILGTSR